MAEKASRRIPIVTDWSLVDLSFQSLCREWSIPEVDIMATWGEQETLLIRLPFFGFPSFGLGYFLLRRLDQLVFNLRFSPMDRRGPGENVRGSLFPGEWLHNSSPLTFQALVPLASREMSCQTYSPGGVLPNPTRFGGRGHLPRVFSTIIYSLGGYEIDSTA